MDVLSDALRVIRLQGALFLNVEFREPWCVPAPAGAELAGMLALGHRHLAVCHLILAGRCWVSLEDGEALPLEAGDVVAFPHGEAHLIGSGHNHARVSAADAVDCPVPNLKRAQYGGDGAATEVVCGWFAYERHLGHPVMGALPKLVRTSIRQRSSSAWLESAIRYAVGEAASERPGGGVVADKLAEVLFVEALRGHMEALPDQETGWLAGLRDPLVGRTIALMHERPAESWTVASLAQAVNASRTVLAERFTALAGIPPMQYLKQWRIALAANLLRGGRLSLTRVAEQVGYESEAAFNRAFKRQYGMPPATWRRRV